MATHQVSQPISIMSSTRGVGDVNLGGHEYKKAPTEVGVFYARFSGPVAAAVEPNERA